MHASSTLPAFVLSQNQTLHKEICGARRPRGGAAGPPTSRRPDSFGRGTFAVPFPCLLRHVRHPFRGPRPLRFGTGRAFRRVWRLLRIVQWLSVSKERVGASAVPRRFPRCPRGGRVPWPGRLACRAATGRHITSAAAGLQAEISENFILFATPCTQALCESRKTRHPPSRTRKTPPQG